MISVNKTAYPRLKRFYNAKELGSIFQPTEEEIQFVLKNARGESQRLTLLVLLKSHQHVGYCPAINKIPKSLWQYLSDQIGFSKDTQLVEPTDTNKKSFHRYRQAIRKYLHIFPWSETAHKMVGDAVKKAAFSMSNPPDLVNVALEKLIEQRYELPAFSTISRLVSHIRHQVHLELYESFSASLSDEQQQILDQLLEVAEGDRITDFSKINEVPRKPTLKLIRNWTTRLAWLQDILDTSNLFEIINPTKVQQFAAEARSLEAQDIKDMKAPKRYTHLVCLIQQQQLLAKDQLVQLFCGGCKELVLEQKKDSKG